MLLVRERIVRIVRLSCDNGINLVYTQLKDIYFIDTRIDQQQIENVMNNSTYRNAQMVYNRSINLNQSITH